MSDLEKHSYDDHYEKDYVCGLCSKVLPTFNLYFKQHLRDHVSLDEEGQQVCPFCHTKWGSMKSRQDIYFSALLIKLLHITARGPFLVYFDRVFLQSKLLIGGLLGLQRAFYSKQSLCKPLKGHSII